MRNYTVEILLILVCIALGFSIAHLPVFAAGPEIEEPGVRFLHCGEELDCSELQGGGMVRAIDRVVVDGRTHTIICYVSRFGQSAEIPACVEVRP